MLTGRSSGASKGIGTRTRRNAPTGLRRPLTRPWGIAMPCPNPVEPRRSRARRLSTTCARLRPDALSRMAAACSNRAFLSGASTSSATCDGSSREEIRLIARAATVPSSPPPCGTWGRRRALLSLRGAAAGGAVVSVLDHLFLVLDDLAVELVHQIVDRRVHVGVAALAEDVAAGHIDLRLDLLLELADGQNHVDVDDVVEVARDTLELRDHVLADGGGDVQLVSGQLQIHRHLLRKLGCYPGSDEV